MRYVLLHGHIFKNAGTTFDWSLQRNFASGFLDHRKDQEMLDNGAEHIADLLKKDTELQAISSHHMIRDLPQIDDLKFIPVFLLRHPFNRLKSAYKFEQRQKKDTPGARAAKSMSFKDYIAWRMKPIVSRTVRNYQTVYLAGRHKMTSDAFLAYSAFGLALETVSSVQTMGIVERYDESMVVLENKLKKYFPEIDLAYVSQNVSKASIGSKVKGLVKPQPETDTFAETMAELGELQKLVIDQNSYDLAIYQLVNTRLDGQIAALDNFSDRLKDFRQRCAKLKSKRV